MAAPRQRGFRARLAGRELQPGSEREFALGFLSRFAQPTGMGSAGAAPMGGGALGAAPMAMGSYAAGPGAVGAGMAGPSGVGGIGMTGAMGMAGRHTPMGGAVATAGYGPADGMHGGGLFGSMSMGGGVFSDSEFELNRESRGGILSVWSRSSRSHFAGLEDALSLDGDVRTTMVGADYSRGALTLGLSVGRPLGLGGYSGPSGGRMSTSMTGFYPWVGYQLNDQVSVWGVTGYGTGSLNLTPDGASALETGVSMAMTAVGTRGELIGSRATGGFALAFKADVLWVGRLSLTPSVEAGLRRDGGDAETGAGMDVGGGLAFTDTVTGLSVDVQVRTLVVHQAGGFRESGMSLSLGWDPTPSTPLGLTARVAPSWRAGDGRGRGAVGQPDGLRHGLAPDVRLRRAAQRGGRLRAAGGRPLRGDAQGRGLDLAVRPGLPVRLRPRRAGAGEGELRAGSRRAAAGGRDGWRGQQRRARPGYHRLVGQGPGGSGMARPPSSHGQLRVPGGRAPRR